MQGDERRRTQRRVLVEDLHCYIDSARIDAASSDISAGGMFVKTVTDAPEGARVALVFRSQADVGSAPVFLVGRVVRVQRAPVPGLGLSWEKAVAFQAPPLAAFLRTRLRLDPEQISAQALGTLGRVRYVFEFPGTRLDPADVLPFTRTPAPEEAPPPFPPMSGPGGSVRSALNDTSDGELRVVTVSPLKSNRKPDLPAATVPEVRSDTTSGPLTGRLDSAALGAPANLPAHLIVGPEQLSVTVTSLSLRGAFATGEKTLPRETVCDFVLSVFTPSGEQRLSGGCRVKGVDDGSTTGTPGMEIEFTGWENPENEDILKRFVRLLHFDALAD